MGRMAGSPVGEGPHRDDLWQQVGKVRIGMLTTIESNGMLKSRPMTVQQVEPDGTLWFFMSADSDVAETVTEDTRVNAAFANPDDNFFLSVSGRAYPIDDREKIEALWTPLASAWFPEGPADPRLRLLRVDAHRVDYWTSGAGKLLQFFAMAKAAVTRERPGPEVGTHGSFRP